MWRPAWMSLMLLVLYCLAKEGTLGAQTPAAVVHAAETIITPTALTGTLAVLHADSLRGMVTPSMALDRAAQYLATQWRQLGLRAGFQGWTPAGRRGEEGKASVLRYPIPGQRRLNYAASRLFFHADIRARGKDVLGEPGNTWGRESEASLARTAHFVEEAGSPVVAQAFVDVAGTGEDVAAGSDQAVLVAGPQTESSLAATDFTGAVVIYIPPAGIDTAGERQVLRMLCASSRGVVLVREPDSTAFALSVAAGQRQSVPVVDAYMQAVRGSGSWPWTIEVWPAAVATVLAAAAVDIPTARATTVPIIRPLGFFVVRLYIAVDTAGSTPVTAPVVLGLVPGTDSLWSEEPVIILAPIDMPTPTVGESGLNLAGLLTLARAFCDSSVHLRRPVILMGTSGETGGQEAWGAHFVAHRIREGEAGRLSVRTTVLTIDLDNSASDTMAVDGEAALELTPTTAWVAAEHSELGLTVIAGEPDVAPASSAGAFVHSYMPALALHAPGKHSSVSAAPFVVDRAARLLRYMFYLGYRLANADHSSRWSREGRDALLHP